MWPERTKVHRQEPEHFLSEGDASACYLEHQGRLLLLLRSEGKPDAGKWGVPAGKVEKGETPLDAAIRELKEETGISVDQNSMHSLGCLYIQRPSSQTLYQWKNFRFHVFKVSLPEAPSVQINGGHQSHTWAAAHEMETMPLIEGGKEAYRFYSSTKPGTKNRMLSIISTYLILEQNDSVLLGLRKNTGYCDGLWAFPAGHVEDGEPATEAMTREAKEELGIEIDPQHLQFVHLIHRQSNRLNLDLFFKCSQWKGTIVNEEPDKCERLQFFPLAALPENCVAYNQKVLKSIAEDVFYSESGW